MVRCGGRGFGLVAVRAGRQWFERSLSSARDALDGAPGYLLNSCSLLRFPDGEPSSDRKVETGFNSPVALRPVGERRKALTGFREFDATVVQRLLASKKTVAWRGSE